MTLRDKIGTIQNSSGMRVCMLELLERIEKLEEHSGGPLVMQHQQGQHHIEPHYKSEGFATLGDAIKAEGKDWAKQAKK